MCGIEVVRGRERRVPGDPAGARCDPDRVGQGGIVRLEQADGLCDLLPGALQPAARALEDRRDKRLARAPLARLGRIAAGRDGKEGGQEDADSGVRRNAFDI